MEDGCGWEETVSKITLIHPTYPPIKKTYFKIPFAVQIGYSR